MRTLALALIVALGAAPMPVEARPQHDKPSEDVVSVRRTAARAIPVGRKVKVTMLSGENHTGKLLAAGDRAVTVETSLIIVELPYEAMRSIELERRVRRRVGLAIVVGALFVGYLILAGAACSHAGC